MRDETSLNCCVLNLFRDNFCTKKDYLAVTGLYKGLLREFAKQRQYKAVYQSK